MTTSSPGTPVDIELLAEYLEDLLEPDIAAEVTARIATDPAWSRAASALRDARPRVADALASADRPAIPVEVADRLAAALATASGPTASVTSLDAARTRRESRSSPTRPEPHTGPGQRTRPEQPARSGSRSRWAPRAGWAVAAAALVVVGGGLGLLIHASGNGAGSESASSADATAPKAAYGGAQPSDLPSLPGIVVTATGQDYGASAAPTGGPSSGPHFPAPHSVRSPTAATDGLARLTTAPNLSACLTAVAVEDGGTAVGADFAAYQGRPALVVRLSTGTIVAVGDECGAPGSGADIIATVQK